MNLETFHPAFFNEEKKMEAILKFELPEDQLKHYYACNGYKYNFIIKKFIEQKQATIQEMAGTPEANVACHDIAELERMAKEFEVLIYRK